MALQDFRFRPPRVRLDDGLRWVLARAFGPVRGDERPLADPQTALRAAGRLGLAPRIAARIPEPRLRHELGDGAEALRATRRLVVASDLRLDAVAEATARVAAERGVSLVFLKGYALRLLGVLLEGGRGAADLDLLAPAERLEELQQRLIAAGFQAADSSEMEHQLPPLTHPSGGVVELHRVVLGLRTGLGGSLRLRDLERQGLLAPAPALAGRAPWPGRCRLPTRPALTAHLLAHGIAQHGYAPHAYPLLRMVADLIDLTAAGALSDAEAAQVRRLLARTVTATEAEAADRLAQRLRHGDASLWNAAPEHDAAAALLHHALAGAFDADYAEALRFQMLRRPLSDRSAAGGAWDSLRHALLPSRAEVAKIYGRSPSRLGYLGLLVLRPFDLARRALRYAASAWRLRRK